MLLTRFLSTAILCLGWLGCSTMISWWRKNASTRIIFHRWNPMENISLVESQHFQCSQDNACPLFYRLSLVNDQRDPCSVVTPKNRRCPLRPIALPLTMSLNEFSYGINWQNSPRKLLRRTSPAVLMDEGKRSMNMFKQRSTPVFPVMILSCDKERRSIVLNRIILSIGLPSNNNLKAIRTYRRMPETSSSIRERTMQFNWRHWVILFARRWNLIWPPEKSITVTGTKSWCTSRWFLERQLDCMLHRDAYGIHGRTIPWRWKYPASIVKFWWLSFSAA